MYPKIEHKDTERERKTRLLLMVPCRRHAIICEREVHGTFIKTNIMIHIEHNGYYALRLNWTGQDTRQSQLIDDKGRAHCKSLN